MGDRVALITGASQGIGKAIALQLAKMGVRVAITSNESENLTRVADEIKNFNPEVIWFNGDARSEDAIQSVVQAVIQRYGRMDILINNVGRIGNLQAFERISPAEWYDLFTLNVMSGVHFSQATLPQMRKNRWGRIIFMASEKASEPGVHMSHYAMTKAAMVSIAKSLANEVGQDGITVNSISPGVILTPSWDSVASHSGQNREDYAAQFCRNVLPGQALGQPEDVATLVGYLCSEAARWITGSNFRVDGGSIKHI